MEQLKQVTLDGRPAWKLRCPMCGTWGYLDDDQLHGRVSTQCPVEGCSYHQTVNWADLQELEKAR